MIIYLVFGALVIGLALGLMGSGGSILTVPVLAFLMGHSEKAAIAESLAIVGGIALVAAIPYAVSRQVDWRSVLFFGLPGMAGTYLGAWLAHFVPGFVQLLLFAVVMLLAAGLMFRQRQTEKGPDAKEDDAEIGEHAKRHAFWKIGLEGLGVGVLTGLVGVGGGFLIVPALVLLGGLSMRLAVGTSLVIIALKSATGFWKYLDVLQADGLPVDWWTIGVFIVIGIAGSFAGSLLAGRLNQTLLRRGFAVFLVAMSVFIFAMQTPKLLPTIPAEPGVDEVKPAAAALFKPVETDME